LLNLVAGLDRPVGGEILVHGRPVDGTLGLTGYMPQRDLLLPWRSVLDNVILGPELAGVPRAEARREALGLLPRFGLEGFEKAYPRTLSGGMRQRAALLRTILTHQETLLLDEPFGALDALTRSEMQEWLLSIWHEFGKTVLFVTHDVEEAVFLSDRVYVMSRRPGSIKLEVNVELPRPRVRGMSAEPHFIRAKQLLLESLLAESGRHLAHPG
jgi:ABC-type nitrate/sulfonate/bicarbonate transport system ATPase subunit